MRENIDVFDFELTDDEMARIAAIDTGATLFFDHADPSGSAGSTASASTDAGLVPVRAACGGEAHRMPDVRQLRP